MDETRQYMSGCMRMYLIERLMNASIKVSISMLCTKIGVQTSCTMCYGDVLRCQDGLKFNLRPVALRFPHLPTGSSDSLAS